MAEYCSRASRAGVPAAQAGMALGPGDWDSQLLTGSGSGEIKYTDFRLLPPETEGGPPAARMGAWKTVSVDDHGPLSAFAAHPYAPLLATASFSQNSQVRPPLAAAWHAEDMSRTADMWHCP